MNSADSATSTPESPFYGRLLLLVSVLCGIGLSIPCLTAGPLAMDEYGTYWIAADGPLTMWERSLDYENIPPFAPWLHRVAMNLFGESEFTFRIPTTVCYVLAIIVSYFLGREFAGPTFGGLVALMTAWHPSALPEVMFARCYGVTLLLSALCFLFTVKWYRFPYRYQGVIGWTVTSIALIWTHYLNAAVVLATMAVMAWRVRVNRRSTLLLLASTMCLLWTISPLYSPLLRMSAWGKYFAFQASVSVFEIIGPMWWAGLPLGLIAAALFNRLNASRIGATGEPTEQSSGKFPRTGLILLILWGFVPTAIIAVVCRGDYASLANPRYRVGFDVAAGCLIVAVFRSRFGRRETAIATMVMLIAAWSCSRYVPWIPPRLNSPASQQWKDLALKIEAEGVAGQPVFVQSGFGESGLVSDLFDDATLHDFAACRLGRFYLKKDVRRYSLPMLWSDETTTPKLYVELALKLVESKVKTIWMVAAIDTDLTHRSAFHFERIMKHVGYQESERVELPDVMLVRYSLPLEPTP